MCVCICACTSEGERERPHLPVAESIRHTHTHTHTPPGIPRKGPRLQLLPAASPGSNNHCIPRNQLEYVCGGVVMLWICQATAPVTVLTLAGTAVPNQASVQEESLSCHLSQHHRHLLPAGLNIALRLKLVRLPLQQGGGTTCCVVQGGQREQAKHVLKGPHPVSVGAAQKRHEQQGF